MSGMITKADLETLSSTRLEDARQLFRTGRFSAAYYLAGYAVELAIKACIAGVFQANAIPDKAFVTAIYSHKLDELLGLAGLKTKLTADMRDDPALSASWGIASKWNQASRYEMRDQFAAASIINAVGDEQHGVLQWLKKHW
jgi:hypothetical protein